WRRHFEVDGDEVRLAHAAVRAGDDGDDVARGAGGGGRGGLSRAARFSPRPHRRTEIRIESDSGTKRTISALQKSGSGIRSRIRARKRYASAAKPAVSAARKSSSVVRTEYPGLQMTRPSPWNTRLFARRPRNPEARRGVLARRWRRDHLRGSCAGRR